MVYPPGVKPRKVYLLVLLTAFSMVLPARSEGDERAPAALRPAELLDRVASSLVTVEFVVQIKASGGGLMIGGEEQLASETTCLMVRSDGVAVCSNTQLEAYSRLTKRFLGPTAQGLSLDVRAKDLRVMAAGGEPVGARIVAIDPELDLAWVKVTEPEGYEFDFVDLSKVAEPEVGQRVWLIQRMEEYFDHTPVAYPAFLGGIVELPRRLFVPTTQLEGGYGLPVFSDHGDLLGLTVLQLPEAGEGPAPGGTLGMMQQTSRLRSLSRIMMLPASTLATATSSALSSLSED